MSHRRRFPTLLGLALLPLFATSTAHAKEDQWTFELAAGGGVAPRYSGSEEFQAAPTLSFDVTSPGGWFLGTSGAGWGTAIGEHTRVRAYVGGSGSRRGKNSILGGSDFLRGMGDIDTRPLVGLAAGYTLGEAVLSGSWQYTLKDDDKGDNGLATQQIHLNLEMPLFDLAGGAVSGSVSTDYGNRGYMQTWYGVSPAQAARTGFAQHKPKAGLVSAGLGMKWSHRAGRNGNWYIAVEGTRLLGDAADSPIVQKANQFGLMTGYTHRF